MTSPLPWTLEVGGLGKIQSASIEPRPLLLLIGKNNSGKSYLASLLWGLLATDELWTMPSHGEAQQRCVEWANRLTQQWSLTSEDYILTEADRGLFSAWLDELLEAKKPSRRTLGPQSLDPSPPGHKRRSLEHDLDL